MKHIHFTSFRTNNAEFEKNYIEKLVGQCAHKKFEKDAFLLREGEECRCVFCGKRTFVLILPGYGREGAYHSVCPRKLVDIRPRRLVL